MAARISMGVAILIATWLGMNPPGFAQVVALAFGIAGASLFPALMMGIFSKRINNVGAIAGMLTGLFTTLVYIFMYKGWFFIAGTANLPDTVEYWILVSRHCHSAIGALLNLRLPLQSLTLPKRLQERFKSWSKVSNIHAAQVVRLIIKPTFAFIC